MNSTITITKHIIKINKNETIDLYSKNYLNALSAIKTSDRDYVSALVKLAEDIQSLQSNQFSYEFNSGATEKLLNSEDFEYLNTFMDNKSKGENLDHQLVIEVVDEDGEIVEIVKELDIHF